MSSGLHINGATARKHAPLSARLHPDGTGVAVRVLLPDIFTFTPHEPYGWCFCRESCAVLSVLAHVTTAIGALTKVFVLRDSRPVRWLDYRYVPAVGALDGIKHHNRHESGPRSCFVLDQRPFGPLPNQSILISRSSGSYTPRKRPGALKNSVGLGTSPTQMRQHRCCQMWSCGGISSPGGAYWGPRGRPSERAEHCEREGPLHETQKNCPRRQRHKA